MLRAACVATVIISAGIGAVVLVGVIFELTMIAAEWMGLPSIYGPFAAAGLGLWLVIFFAVRSEAG